MLGGSVRVTACIKCNIRSTCKLHSHFFPVGVSLIPNSRSCQHKELSSQGKTLGKKRKKSPETFTATST